MLKEFLPQMRPFFDNAERNALKNYNFEDGYLTEFKATQEFENKLSDLLKSEAIAVNNGTVALTIAALTVGVEPNDEVIVPNFTMIATPNAMKLLGAKPVFCDIELSTWCLCTEDLFHKITPRTKAVVLVSANGRTPTYDVDSLRIRLNKRGISLIEDAAQSLGSFYRDGSAVGTKGNIATLSFSAPKIISTGQGGLVFSSDKKLMEVARTIKDFGRSAGGTDIHDHFGINSKFTELQALVGIAQLEKLEERKKVRKQQNQLYREYLAPKLVMPEHDYSITTPWFTEIILENRTKVIDALLACNVGSRVVYPEVNKQKLYDAHDVLPNSKYISANALWLPSHMGVTRDHIRKISEIINSQL